MELLELDKRACINVDECVESHAAVCADVRICVIAEVKPLLGSVRDFVDCWIVQVGCILLRVCSNWVSVCFYFSDVDISKCHCFHPPFYSSSFLRFFFALA